jgi:hypothetical protein
MVDEHRMFALTRSLTSVPSRRDVLRGLAGIGLGLGVVRFPGAAEAKSKKRRKNKAKKPRPNQYGCLSVGARCKNADQCCSGICEGKKCRAHDTGACAAGTHPAGCGGASTVSCTTSLGKAGVCGTTTGKAGYCFASGQCFACTTDAECQVAEDGKYGPRAACVRCALECATTGGTACVGPDTIEVPV